MMPSLFVSHGSPMMVIEDSPASRFLKQWGEGFDRPEAILMISAHWENSLVPLVSLAVRPETIHDFDGFPRALYGIRYDCPGAPDMARLAVDLLHAESFEAVAVPDRGLDHGAWAPLSLMYPDADIPVFQVSLIRGMGPREHYRMGLALKSLREKGVLVIGSGSMTHNLLEYMGSSPEDPAPPWVTDFQTWMKETLESGRVEDLLDYRAAAPHARRNHPTEEHLLPLFAACGAAGEKAGAIRVHSSHAYGVIAMDMYVFQEND